MLLLVTERKVSLSFVVFTSRSVLTVNLSDESLAEKAKRDSFDASHHPISSLAVGLVIFLPIPTLPPEEIVKREPLPYFSI